MIRFNKVQKFIDEKGFTFLGYMIPGSNYDVLTFETNKGKTINFAINENGKCWVSAYNSKLGFEQYLYDLQNVSTDYALATLREKL